MGHRRYLLRVPRTAVRSRTTRTSAPTQAARSSRAPTSTACRSRVRHRLDLLRQRRPRGERRIGFLPIYIGPTLMIALWWVVMRKILRISKENRITSLADFIAALRQERAHRRCRDGDRGDRHRALHLAAAEGGVERLDPDAVPRYRDAGEGRRGAAMQDKFVALILALFTIAFGTRHLDAAEHHEGMVAAIAFESLVKLLAFLAVGVYVTFFIYDGFGDVFARAAADEAPADAHAARGRGGTIRAGSGSPSSSMLAIMFLPRQFQVTVIENKDERHLNKAIWLFPLYMLAINVFVLPIAFGGRLHFPPALWTPTPTSSPSRCSRRKSCSRCSCSSAGSRRRPAW